MAHSLIIFEDKSVLVIDKPAGVSVQTDSKAGISGELKKYLGDAIKKGSAEPELVHRLDKDTSGVLIIAKNIPTKVYLQRQFKDRQVSKKYWALVEGVPQHPEAVIDLPIGRSSKNPLKRAVRSSGKPAQTKYKIKQVYSAKKDERQYSLLEVSPATGRTHQIRVHLSHIRHPVVSDTLYGHKHPLLKRHWLHAYKLVLSLPSGQEHTFTAPLPSELSNLLDEYNKV